MHKLSAPLFALCLLVLGGCTGLPENVQPVDNFQLERYLGRWYEIARLDHSFERGLSRVTAEYSLNEDGTVRVVNRGYSAEDRAWQQSEGRAKFVADKNTGHLKVSFFGPFYASYVVVALDEDYRHALVAGFNKSYLWILSREPEMSAAEVQALVAKAKSLGFPADRLMFIEQGSIPSGLGN